MVMYWIDLASGSEEWWELVNEPLGSIKCKEFLG
jgi:hypothetical protein